MSHEPNDRDLVAGIKSSNEAAFKALYMRYFDELYKFVLNRTREREVALDIVQDLFGSLWQNRESLRPENSIKSYLYRSAINSGIDHLRKEVTRRHYRENRQSAGEPFIDPIEEPGLREQIDLAISQLPDDLKTVFEMHRFQEFKYKEIAETLGISVKTVESRMSKALKILHQTLRPFLAVVVSLGTLKLW